MFEGMAKLEAVLIEQHGSGWGDFKKGPEIKNVSDVAVDDLLLNYSPQFNSKNVFSVSRIRPGRALAGASQNDNAFYGYFVNPQNPKTKRMASDKEIIVWDSTLGKSEKFWRARR